MNNVAKYFDEEVAKNIGTDSAIILQNIEFWQQKNQANNKNFYDGRYWTYNSVSAYEQLFSWLSIKQIRTCLSKLEKCGYLVTGNYNTSHYDRTKWYSSVRVHSTCPSEQIDLPKSANETAQMGEPIPYNKPYNNTDNKRKTKVFQKPSVKEIRDYCLERKNNVDAENFFDFYESKDWMVGKNKMKNWKASVRTWERKSNNQVNQPQQEKPTRSAEELAKMKAEHEARMEEKMRKIREESFKKMKNEQVGN